MQILEDGVSQQDQDRRINIGTRVVRSACYSNQVRPGFVDESALTVFAFDCSDYQSKQASLRKVQFAYCVPPFVLL
jgi:hypothetical protein